MVKTGQFGDPPGDEQRAAIRDLVLRLAEEREFHERLTLVPALITIRQDLDNLTKSVAEIGGSIAALTARAPAAVQAEDPAYQRLRWEKGVVAINPGAQVREQDTAIPQLVRDAWKVTRHS